MDRAKLSGEWRCRVFGVREGHGGREGTSKVDKG